MEMIKVKQLDASNCKLECSNATLYSLSDVFSYMVPNPQFIPKVKSGQWDGKIRLVNSRNKTMPVGLLNRLQNYCNHMEMQLVSEVSIEPNDFSEDECEAFVQSLELQITPRDYQIQAFIHAIRNQRSLIVSPTGSGKSLILYLTTEFCVQLGLKVLVIVPTVNLVTQMAQDFLNYSEGRRDVKQIRSGTDKEFDSDVVISTWQSLQRMDKSDFSSVDAVIVDECHLATGAVLQKILNYCSNADFRLGTTGTLTGEKVHEMMLIAAIGEPKQFVTTDDLIRDNVLSPLKINCLVLRHEQSPSIYDYQSEIDYIINHHARNRYIINLTKSLKGNTLVLFSRVETHGKVLYEMLEKENLAQNLFFMAGETKGEVRENIRQHVRENADGNIIVASSGVFSTGIDIPALHNVIFASPTKSKIRVLQSIGRILRVHGSKETAVVYDIVDKLITSPKNYAYQHFEERYRYYIEEDFDTDLYEISLST